MLPQENISYGSFKHIFDNYQNCGNVVLFPPNFFFPGLFYRKLYAVSFLPKYTHLGPVMGPSVSHPKYFPLLHRTQT